MESNIIKITYHFGGKKINTYLKAQLSSFIYTKSVIESCLFEERNLPHCEIRIYWIDEDKDEIEILNECDFQIFAEKSGGSRHLEVAPVGIQIEEPAAATISSANSASNEATIPPAAGSYDFAVHHHVECDSCLMSPIIGFRYKCIQCPNYDLCQNCETKNIHSEHMMVRMPSNNCPNVIEAYVTGRTTRRRHDKRSKTSCPYFKNGLSEAIDNDNESQTIANENVGGENSKPSSSSANGKERRHGRNRRHKDKGVLVQLFEAMCEMGEGGGVAAEAAGSTGESNISSKSAASKNLPQTTTAKACDLNTKIIEAADKAAETAEKAAQTTALNAKVAANTAAQQALVAAAKAVEIAESVTALNTKPTLTSVGTTSEAAVATEGQEEEKLTRKEEGNAATLTPPETVSQTSSVPVSPSLPLEAIAQFLDPQYMKTGIQILNNFSDMFAKMLDPMETIDASHSRQSNLPNSSMSSNKSSIASSLNSLGSEKKIDEEKPTDKTQVKEEKSEEEKDTQKSDVESNVEIEDLGSDSESDGVSDSFVKINVPKVNSEQPSPSTSSTSAQTTPPPSLDKSNVVDFAQLSADLKAHIAEEAGEEQSKPMENVKDIEDNNSYPTTFVNENVNDSNSTTVKKNEEKRFLPVYHADPRINNSIIAMMSMGFSNEGAWLTQLLENVNGNIGEALDVMTAAQLHDQTRRQNDV